MKQIIKNNKNKQKGITPEFKKWLNEFNNEHYDALKELAKR